MSDGAPCVSRGRSGAISRPQLRAVEVIRVLRAQGEWVTLLRDPERVALRSVEVPEPLDRALPLMNGRRSAVEIAQLAAATLPIAGRDVGPSALAIEDLAVELEAAGMLEGPTASARRLSLLASFRASPVRLPGFAGGAYHADPAELRRFLDEECLWKAAPRAFAGKVRGLVAPHMDLWRAAHGYGAAYRALADHLPDELDTIVVLGTCHAGMRSPFAFTKKSFATPLGLLQTHTDLVHAVSSSARFDVLEDEYKHQGEHSIEFQLLFLQHILGRRVHEVRVLPILCGLGHAQARRLDPDLDLEAASVLESLLCVLESKRTLVIAGADLAHVGPRFGDERPLDAPGRRELELRDAESLDLLLAQDAPGFFAQVTEDLSERRVCGIGPLYTLCRALSIVGPTRSELLGYTQHIDEEEGSIVSHASVAFVSADSA